VRLGYGSPGHAAQRLARDGLDAEGHSSEAGPAEQEKQVIIEAIEAGFAVESEAKATGEHLVAQAEAAIPILGKKRVAKHNMGARIEIAKLLELAGDVANGTGAEAGENPMGAIGAKLGTTAAGQDGETALSHGLITSGRLIEKVPSGKRQRIEVTKRRAWNEAREKLAGSEALHRCFRLSHDEEVGVIAEEFRHFRTGEANETNPESSPACFGGPLRFAAVVHEGGKDESHICRGQIAASKRDVMAVGGKNCGQVAHLDAGQVEPALFEVAENPCHFREGNKSRSVASGHGILCNQAFGSLEIS